MIVVHSRGGGENDILEDLDTIGLCTLSPCALCDLSFVDYVVFIICICPCAGEVSDQTSDLQFIVYDNLYNFNL